MSNPQPTFTARVTHVRRFGFVQAPVPECDMLYTDPAKWPRYIVTYMHLQRPHDIELVDDGKGGFQAKVEKAVRQDMERRRYIECRDELVKLPLEVTL